MNFSSTRRFLGVCAFLSLGALASTVVSTALAEDEGFDLSVDKGQVTVTAREHWHINQDYPWKLVIGDVKVDKSKFTLSEKTASVSDAPKGTGKLRGAVCSKDACKMLEKEVTIR